MGWKYELTGDASVAEIAVPGTGELVTIEKGKPVELDVNLGPVLPPGVTATEVKTKAEKEAEAEAKAAAKEKEEEAS